MKIAEVPRCAIAAALVPAHRDQASRQVIGDTGQLVPARQAMTTLTVTQAAIQQASPEPEDGGSDG